MRMTKRVLALALTGLLLAACSHKDKDEIESTRLNSSHLRTSRMPSSA